MLALILIVLSTVGSVFCCFYSVALIVLANIMVELDLPCAVGAAQLAGVVCALPATFVAVLILFKYLRHIAKMFPEYDEQFKKFPEAEVEPTQKHEHPARSRAGTRRF